PITIYRSPSCFVPQLPTTAPLFPMTVPLENPHPLGLEYLTHFVRAESATAVSRWKNGFEQMRFVILALLVGAGLTACSKKEPAPAGPRPEAPKAVSISAETTPEAPPPPTAPASAIETAPAAGDATPSTSVNPTPTEDRIVDDLQAALQAYYLANVNSA